MSLSTTIKAMLAAGCTPEQMAEVVAAHEREEEEIKAIRRAKRAAQKRVERERRRHVSLYVAATDGDNARHAATTGDISLPSPSSSNGFPPSHIVNNYTPPSLTPSSSSLPLLRSQRGTRLQQDWEPSETDIAFAKDFAVNVQAEAEKFRDHFIAQPGQRGVKVDWSATWRNWIRNAGKSKPPPAAKKDTYQEIVDRLTRKFENERDGSNQGDRNTLFDLRAGENPRKQV